MIRKNLCGIQLIFTDCFVIGAKLVSEWLIVSEVARLDSAFCSNDRHKFLELISSNSVYINQGKATDRNILEWSMARRAKLRQLIMASFPVVTYETWVWYLREQGSRIREIVYDVISWNEELNGLLLHVAQYCVALETFHLQSYISEYEQIAVVLCACRNLTDVSLQGLSMTSFAVLTTFCTRLRVLKANIDPEPGSAKKLSEICNLPELQKLELTCYCTHPHFPSAVSTIATSCRRLSQVSVNPLSEEGAMVFAMHCPDMQCFEATLSEALTTSLMDAITANWKSLHHLRLWQKAEISLWSDALDTAVVNLIQEVASLQNLVCFNGNEAAALFDQRFRTRWDMVNTPKISPVTSALRLLWVTQLSATAVNTVITRCPALADVAHNATVDPLVLHALGASNIKTLRFPGTGIGTGGLDELHDLHELQMWDIDEDSDEALVALAKRSPAMKSLQLMFNRRPPLRFFPNFLHHTRRLEQFCVCVDVSAAEESESESEDAKEEMAEAMELLAQLLCSNLTEVIVLF